MQESVLAIMNYLFRNNVCNQLSTEVKCGNTSSIKLLEKVGFVKLESSREKYGMNQYSNKNNVFFYDLIELTSTFHLLV